LAVSLREDRAVTDSQTLGALLERDRLLHRAQRIERVIAALRDRAVYRHEVTGTTPLPLHAAMADFHRELAVLKRRLAQLPNAA
jgi:hypothetical protein